MTVRELRDRLDAAVKGGFGDIEVHYLSDNNELSNLYVEDVGTAIWWDYEIINMGQDAMFAYKVFLLNRNDDDAHNVHALRQAIEDSDGAALIWKGE